MGESELVLDSLPVEEVLRMIGAPKATTDATASGSASESGLGASSGSGLGTHSGSAITAPPAAAPPPPSPREVTSTSTSVTSETQSFTAPDSGPPMAPLPSSNWRELLKPGVATPGRDSSAREDAAAGSARETAATSVPTRITERTSEVPGADSNVPLPSWLIALGIPEGLSAGRKAAAFVPPNIAVLDSLDAVAGVIASCRACALGATALNPVPGDGNSHADFVCVGEAPGQSEDESGRPFVGPSGQLLTKILAAIQLQREDVFICNVVKHRPPGNRDPLPEEVHACTPYLTRQLQLVQPKVILALGTFAAQTLLQTKVALGKLRGQVHRYQGIPLIVTYHPSALLRNDAWKRPAWDDVKLARRILDAARAASLPA
jgi:uracil-DNA glycosylase family 4